MRKRTAPGRTRRTSDSDQDCIADKGSKLGSWRSGLQSKCRSLLSPLQNRDPERAEAQRAESDFFRIACARKNRTPTIPEMRRTAKPTPIMAIPVVDLP